MSLISGAVNGYLDYWDAWMMMPVFLLAAGGFIVAVGLPVSIVSYYIVRNKGKSRRLLNFSIHVLSAAVAGFFIFREVYGILLTVFAGFLYFLFDEWLLYHSKHEPVKGTKWDTAFVALVLVCIGVPLFMAIWNSGREEDDDLPDLSKPPVISVVWNEKTLESIKPKYCKVEVKGCTKEMDPYYTDSLKGDVLDTYYSNTFTLSAANREGEPEFEIYYLEGEEVKELRPVNGVYVVPLGLKDQVMKGNAVWENEILTFEATVNMIETSPAK
ncbi:hypothetical protein [Metabacillus indicus]|uniref:hypothetical protein n=1 Tax=Metabacillus indicus TaxID=246786 RepID=UPI001300C804|nr:hypothetical protein [Metabacillus indicus]